MTQPSVEGSSSSSSSSSSSTGNLKPIDSNNDDVNAASVDPSVALSECLLSQYTVMATAVAGSTGYALYRKPRNGIGIMLVAGGAGMIGDFVYGWFHACQPQVKAWYNKPPSP